MEVYGEVEILLEIFLILAATTNAFVTEKSLSLLGIKSQPVICHCHSINNAHLSVCFDVPSLESLMKTRKVTNNVHWA